MSTVYDSGWVPASIGVAPGSGSVVGSVQLGGFSRVKIIYAASGSAGVSNNASNAYLSWSAGAASPIPWNSSPRNKTPAYPTTPLVTGTYTVTAPNAGLNNSYVFGSNLSGANHLDDWVPETIYFGMTQGSGSYVRIIVEGR